MEQPPASTAQRVPLHEEDARILALESGAIRGHTVKVLVLADTGGPLRVDDLRARLADRLPHQPAWTRRLVSDPNTASRLAWEPDPCVDLARQVVEIGAGTAPDDAGLRALVADTMTRPLDRDRPLWSMQVVPRLNDGRSAVVWKVHHCLADGMTIMRAGPRLLWTEQQPTAPSSPPPPGVPGAARRLVEGARLARVVGYRGLLVREFRRVWGLSPLAGDVGPDRTAAWIRCDLAVLRDVGRAREPHATVNDVLLAAVSGALRTWLRARGRPLTAMKAQVPVSMHPTFGVDRDGNRDSFLLVRLPIGESDPLARLAAVASATRRRKNRHDAHAIYALRGSLSHAPAAVQRRLQHLVQGPHEYSLSISNVPGPRGPIAALGRHVEALYSFAEVAPHHGLRIAAVSLEDGLYLGLLADPHLVPDLAELAAGIGAEVGLLHDLLLPLPR